MRPGRGWLMACGAPVLCVTACQEVPIEPVFAEPINVSVVAARADLVACGDQIAVTATALGPNRKPLAGLLVNFNVLAGGGHVFGGAALTGKDGVAREIWTIGLRAEEANTLAVRSVDAATGAGTTHFTQTVIPQGKLVFAMEIGGQLDIFVVGPDGSQPVNLTRHPANDEQPTWSPDGSRIVFVSDREGQPDLYVMNADGTGVARISDHVSEKRNPAWSPDGRRIALVNRDDDENEFDIYIVNPDGSDPNRVTNLPGDDLEPDWSPDSRRIVFRSRHEGSSALYVIDSDGSNLQRLSDSTDDRDPAWSPTGDRIAFVRRIADGIDHIWTMNVDGTNAMPLVNAPGENANPNWSPGGGRIAFHTNRDGEFAVHTVNADGSNDVRLLRRPERHGMPNWSSCTWRARNVRERSDP